MNYIGIPGVKNEYRAKCAPVITAENIIKTVCDHFGIELVALKSSGRLSECVHARHVIFYFLRKHTNMSLKSMAEIFNRDHTTVIHGLEKLSDIMQTEPNIKSEVELLQVMINELGTQQHLTKKFLHS